MGLELGNGGFQPDTLVPHTVSPALGEQDRVPFVVISGFLTIETAVEAMKLGALSALQKPVWADDLLAIVRPAVEVRRSPGRAKGAPRGAPEASTPRPAQRTLQQPKSAAERWAWYVLRACESEGDLRTLGAWATFAGVSYSSLRESCRLVGIQPHDARDLARVLRAVLLSRVHRCPAEVLLDVSDQRTLRTLLARAGIESGPLARPVPVERVLALQQFVAQDNPALRVLRGLLLTPSSPL